VVYNQGYRSYHGKNEQEEIFNFGEKISVQNNGLDRMIGY
jgi:hypothetical protein